MSRLPEWTNVCWNAGGKSAYDGVPEGLGRQGGEEEKPETSVTIVAPLALEPLVA